MELCETRGRCTKPLSIQGKFTNINMAVGRSSGRLHTEMCLNLQCALESHGKLKLRKEGKGEARRRGKEERQRRQQRRRGKQICQPYCQLNQSVATMARCAVRLQDPCSRRYSAEEFAGERKESQTDPHSHGILKVTL